MFTPKLLAVAFAATFTLTACNSSTTKPDVQASHIATTLVAAKKGPKGTAGTAHDNEKKLGFSVSYSKYDPDTKKISELQENDHLEKDDRYKITIKSNKDVYVYVYQIDSEGKLFNLLKLAGKHHEHFPLKSGEKLFLPSKDASYRLDDAKGVESIFVVATEEADSTIEKTYSALARDFKHEADSSVSSSKKGKIPSRKGRKGVQKGIITDKEDEEVYFFNFSGGTTANKISCEEQPSCASSINFFNNINE